MSRRGGATASPGPRLTTADVRPPYPRSNLYDLATLRTIFLQFENADWEEELAFFFNSDVDVPATMIVDGRTYRDVGVHFRGASSFRNTPAGFKRSLNIAMVSRTRTRMWAAIGRSSCPTTPALPQASPTLATR